MIQMLLRIADDSPRAAWHNCSALAVAGKRLAQYSFFEQGTGPPAGGAVCGPWL